MSGAADKNKDMRKITRSLKKLSFIKPISNTIAMGNIYNSRTPLGRAAFSDTLRKNALLASMPTMTYNNAERRSRSYVSNAERHILANPVFGTGVSSSARSTRKRARNKSQNISSNAVRSSKRARYNTNHNPVQFIGNSNSPRVPAGVRTTGVQGYIQLQPIPPLQIGEYVVATYTAPSTGILGNPLNGNLGFINNISIPLLSGEFVKQYTVALVADPAHPTSIYKEGQLMLAPPSAQPSAQPSAPANASQQSVKKSEEFAYYNPYYLTVEGPVSEVQAQGRLLPHGMFVNSREEIEAMGDGDEKTLLDFYYAWPALIETVSGIYRDFLRKIYKIQSKTKRSPHAFTMLIHESIIPKRPNPAFLYGIKLLLINPRGFAQRGRHYTEAFIQTLIDNGIYKPQRTREAVGLSIQERIELYLRIILFHQFTQMLNPWVNKIFKIEIHARSGNTHTRRVNVNMAKWSYKIHHISKLQLADRRVLDAAFDTAKRLALQHA